MEIAKVYRHYKGNYYYVLGIAEYTEKYDILVIYHALYDECDTYARPLEMFIEEVPEDKENPTGQKYRFEVVGEIDRDATNQTRRV
ncbi:DUF1653 domain-containing protein [Virgibacillus profundi]|uniref:DUF1653 domain-containing protein n=1 Tax=Virgibacillus profundi TaxID=2024555 RepID=UPI001F0A6BBF|nr:DUF1653 domain-containing protein [Virgibacillus profundi]